MNALLTPESAAIFACQWIAAWNTRDLDLILSHYSDDVEFRSPFVRRLLDGPSDQVCGLAELRAYFAQALNLYPDLRFTLRRTYCGVRSLVLEYQSVSNLRAAEFMEFDEVGLVCRAQAHYAPAAATPSACVRLKRSTGVAVATVIAPARAVDGAAGASDYHRFAPAINRPSKAGYRRSLRSQSTNPTLRWRALDDSDR